MHQLNYRAIIHWQENNHFTLHMHTDKIKHSIRVIYIVFLKNNIFIQFKNIFTNPEYKV